MTQILIVDDSASIRQLSAFTLKSGGYDCIEAENGVDALAICQENKFDLVITDLNMPKMGGFELALNLRSDTSFENTPILVLTTEADKDLKIRGKESGVNGWIVKPFNPESLLKVVGRFTPA